ncbi:MAG TPA: endolytic transglycosylase MltG [Puia sp.]|nr:endolytic transglycosylase MltG [Puia sp.]
MKKFIAAVIVLLLIVCGFVGWRVLGPGTAFSGDSYFLYIHTGMSYDQVARLLEKDTVVKNPALFNWVARRMHYPNSVRAGKYEIRKDMSVLNIIRMLHNGRQTPVKIVITKFRTPEGFAGAVGKKLECDSTEIAAFIHNDDSLREFGVDSNTFLTIVLPNTYTYFWNITPSVLFRKMYAFYKAWWTPARIAAANARGLTPTTATILASIVEEETNIPSDKGKIASVYLNRLSKGMRLEADPTVKFAMRDFELKEIYYGYLKTRSPYNTYMHGGLPPGPICTPSEATLQAVLAAPATDYLYFVAKPDFSGYSNFAATFKDHQVYAKAWTDALKKQRAIRDSSGRER